MSIYWQDVLDSLRFRLATTSLTNAQLRELQVAKYITVVSLTILLYDYLLTLPDELYLVWPSKFGVSKVLYYLNRYLVLIEPIFLIWSTVNSGNSKACVPIFKMIGYLTVVGFIIAEAILMIRTWAIWDRNRTVTVILVAILCIDTAGFILTQIFYGKGLGFIPSYEPSISIALGCRTTFKNRLIFIEVLLVMFTEAILLVFLVIRASQQFRDSQSDLMIVIYNDGIIYFVLVLLTSIVNLVVILTAPLELHNLLVGIQRILHSIFCTRILLHIRSVFSATNAGGTTSSTDSELRAFEHIRLDRPVFHFDNMSPAFRTAYLRNRALTFRASLISRVSGFGGDRTRAHDSPLPLSARRSWDSENRCDVDGKSGEDIKMSTINLPMGRLNKLDGNGEYSELDESRLPHM